MVERERGSSQAMEPRPESTEVSMEFLPPPASIELKREVVLRWFCGGGGSVNGSILLLLMYTAKVYTHFFNSF